MSGGGTKDVMGDIVPGIGNITYVNEAGISDEELQALRGNSDIANAIERWSQELNAAAQPTSQSMRTFSTVKASRYKGAFADMARCAWAVESDDILSTLADVSESLSFQKVRFELFNPAEQDFWNQWAARVNLDDFLRKAHRELFKVSQVYVGMWWEVAKFKIRKDRTVDTLNDLEEEGRRQAARGEGGAEPAVDKKAEKKKGPGRGNYERDRIVSVNVPTALTVFDPTKIVPVGTMMFGRERFAYIASPGEQRAFLDVFEGQAADGTVLQLIEDRYKPSESERQELSALGIATENLWLMRRNAVFRHALTRANYERFAPVRLRSIIPILDMKDHLRASDRASLVGNTNFIIVVTKGSDKLPARPEEIANLQEQVKVIARLPVLVGDHRLNVEIVSPALDNTLIESRWEVLDSRLVFRALQTFQPTIQGGNSSSGVKEMGRIVARGLESRRHMLVRTMESAIFRAILDENDDSSLLSESPSLEFSPRRISLDFSAEVISGVLKLRDRGDLSRETTLEELDYDQDIEVLRRAREKVRYDDVFMSQTPFSSPDANPYAGGGNLGPNGQPRTEGGRPPGVHEDEPRETK